MKKLVILRESKQGHRVSFLFDIDQANDQLILKDVLVENKYSIKDLMDPDIIQGVYDEVYNEYIIGVS